MWIILNISTSFVDRYMFMRYRGGGVGHKSTWHLNDLLKSTLTEVVSTDDDDDEEEEEENEEMDAASENEEIEAVDESEDDVDGSEDECASVVSVEYASM